MSLAIDPGTFEDPQGVTAWSVTGGGLTRTSSLAHSGIYSALITVSGSPTQAYIRAYGASAVPVTPGTLYEVTMWVRSPQALAVLPAVDIYDGSSNYIGGEYPATVTLVPNTWTELALTFLAPPSSALVVYGPTAVSPANGNTLYVDDVDIDVPDPGGVSATATEQDSWPPRVQIAVTGLTAGDQVEVHRQVAGVLTLVRGGVLDDAVDPSFVIVDAELPFGVPVNWVVFVNGVGQTVAGDTYTLAGGNVAITDAITGAAAEVKIGADGGKTYARTATRFRVGGQNSRGRNMVVSGPIGQAEGSYEILTETTSARDNLLNVLATATQGIVQIRQSGAISATGDRYAGVDAYLAVDRVSERRFSQDGSDPRRLVTIEYAEVDGWASDLTASGFTLQDLADFFEPGDTLADLAAFFPAGNLLDIALADWTP